MIKDWEKAMVLFESVEFPNDVLLAAERTATHHTATPHPMKGYVITKKLEGYDWYSSYSYCRDCGMIVSKNMQLFGEKTCLNRTMIKGGKNIGE